MTYLINLSLPLYFMLLPLGIAVYLANKYYKWKAKYYALKEDADVTLLQSIYENRELKERLQDQSANTISLSQAIGMSDEIASLSEKLGKAESELEAARVRADNYTSLSDMYKKQTEKDAEIIRGLNAQAVEREALITELNREFAAAQSEIERLIPIASDINDLKTIHEYLVKDYEQLESKLQLSELAHIETQTDLDGERYYLDAVAEAYKILYDIVKRNSRTRKQYDGAMKSIGEKRAFAMGNLNRSILALADKNPTETPQSETVVHDTLGVARVFQADQSEAVNNRHNVVNICNEVNRGIAEQAERIRQELRAVDMSTLQVGDTVKFLNGTFDTVDRINKCNGDWDYRVYFSDGTVGTYMSDGSFRISSTLNLKQWSIIQIIKPAKCYKSNKPCEFNCQGLCKESQ